MSKKNQWFGKYRAFVTDVEDPEKRGRIRVKCPKVLGESKSSWCEVCMPVAYENGGDFYLPQVGEAVWVEFEEGDADKPVWVGGWWSSNHTPFSDYSQAKTNRIIEYKGAKIVLSCGKITVDSGNSHIVLDSNININSSGTIYVNGHPLVNIPEVQIGGSAPQSGIKLWVDEND